MELFLITIAYLIGIIMGLYFKKGIALFVIFWAILNLYRKKNRYLKLYCKNLYMFLFLISFLLAFIRINNLEQNYNKKCIDISNANEEIKIEGTIVSDIKEEDYNSICTLKIERINGNNRR